MAEDQTSPLRRLAVRMCITFGTLLLLYPLSSGPTGLLVMLTRHGDRTWMSFYAPVAFVAEQTHTVPLFMWYLDIWKNLAIRLSPRERVDDPIIE